MHKTQFEQFINEAPSDLSFTHKYQNNVFCCFYTVFGKVAAKNKSKLIH